jgi:GYF domain 2
MKYYIRRDLNEYGPYTLADLQRYVAQGNIALTDQTRSEGMTDWVPVSQVIGNIPAPPGGGTVYGGPAAASTPYMSGATPSAGGTVFSGTPAYSSVSPNMSATPVPPDFHWALVLLIGIVTCGIFFWVWFLVEAAFVRKIRPQSNGIIFAAGALVCNIGGQFIRIVGVLGHHFGLTPFGSLVGIASFVLYVVAAFTIKSDLEEYYNSGEPINLKLNGVMVFFFAVFYFQHHFSRISRWKKTGVLEPQG